MVKIRFVYNVNVLIRLPIYTITHINVYMYAENNSIGVFYDCLEEVSIGSRFCLSNISTHVGDQEYL